MARRCQQKKRTVIFLLSEEAMREEWISQEPCICVNMIMDRLVMELDVEQKMVKRVDTKLAATKTIKHILTEPNSD